MNVLYVHSCGASKMALVVSKIAYSDAQFSSISRHSLSYPAKEKKLMYKNNYLDAFRVASVNKIHGKIHYLIKWMPERKMLIIKVVQIVIEVKI